MEATGAADLLARWNGCGFYRMVGMRVERADEDGSTFRIGVTPDHTQLYGTAHGGVLAGLLDAAMALAILGRLPADEGCATIEMKINFTAPAPPGELLAEGRVLTMGRRIAVASAEARDGDGRVVCVSQGTFQRFAAGAA
jgi:acyl-CoA thioesterase